MNLYPHAPIGPIINGLADASPATALWVLAALVLVLLVFVGIDRLCKRWDRAAHNIWASDVAAAETAEHAAAAAWRHAAGPNRTATHLAFEVATRTRKELQAVEPSAR